MNKEPVRRFMREHYSDERLAQLLAHARDGKLSYNSCCCFIGVVTADHALKGFQGRTIDALAHRPYVHYVTASYLLGATEAEKAFFKFGMTEEFKIEHDRIDESVEKILHNEQLAEVRRRILIPIIRAEMKRREKMPLVFEEAVEAQEKVWVGP